MLLSPPSSFSRLAQILQQNVLLKFKYFVKFLQQHGSEVFPEVRKEYVETLSRIYRSAICARPDGVGGTGHTGSRQDQANHFAQMTM